MQFTRQWLARIRELARWYRGRFVNGGHGNRELILDPSLYEPFNNGRDTGRLLYDVGAMISLLNPAMLSSPVLEFGDGMCCWITETIAKMGQQVAAFDIHSNIEGWMASSTFTLRNWCKFRRGNLRLRLGFARKMAYRDL
jgi:hypothetical protein